jgi:hypothetical protein
MLSQTILPPAPQKQTGFVTICQMCNFSHKFIKFDSIPV